MTVNKITLVGNLGADPEIRTANSGTQIANLRIATTERVKKGDTWEEATEWHRVVVFGKTAENCGRFLTKGRQVYIEGRIQTRKYQDKDGNDRYATEVVAREVKFLGGGSGERRPADSGGGGRRPDDDVPF